jgi:small subunit ribosomal protein S6
MNHYETIVIFHPDLSEEDLEAQAEALKDRFTAGGAEISDFEHWGKRRLAYDIRRQRYGYYVLYRYTGPSPLIRQTEQNLSISEQVLKYLTVRCKPDEATPPDLLRSDRTRGEDGEFAGSEDSPGYRARLQSDRSSPASPPPQDKSGGQTDEGAPRTDEMPEPAADTPKADVAPEPTAES